MRLTLSQAGWLADQVRRASGIALDPRNSGFLEARLEPLLRGERIADVDGLIRQLGAADASPGLLARVVACLATTDTCFFRSRDAFEALRTQVLPALKSARPSGKRVRIWCAACSTGQEVYSVAMVARELGWTAADVEILASDISIPVLESARRGLYSQMEVNRGLSAQLLRAHFEREGRHWRVSEELLDLVEFSHHNLVRDEALGPDLDLVLCRNVLIYFDPPTRAVVLARLHAALRPQGALLLGSEERADDAAPFFAPSPETSAPGFFRPTAPPVSSLRSSSAL